MTHYWWMHWFWITSRLTLCVVIIHSTESTTVSSPVPASYLNPQENLNLTESSEPMNSTTICNKTIFNENLETSPSASDLENSTTTNIDVENTTVIVTQSKELVSKGVHGQQQVEATWTAASITGLCLGVVAVATVLAAASAVLYRRRYLNKPHALNDKCSNPDSSGYIDDSTMRENSEEMYSLDNDSFLNSLEAMTIQNYWTDSVKHTKL